MSLMYSNFFLCFIFKCNFQPTTFNYRIVELSNLITRWQILIEILFYIKNNIYIPLKKSETKSLVSHIKLDKKKNYHNNTVVGVDQIYLGKELIYEEDIYITKNKNIAKESILSKIKKWFHD